MTSRSDRLAVAVPWVAPNPGAIAAALVSVTEAPELTHQRFRLWILATLHVAGRSEFMQLRRAGDVSDGNLSRHLRVLEDAGLVEITRGFVGRRARTWVTLTQTGTRAVLREADLLRPLVLAIDAVSRPIGPLTEHDPLQPSGAAPTPAVGLARRR